MGLLDANRSLRRVDVALSACPSHALHSEPYRFFTNRSGLPQTLFGKLWLLGGAIPFVKSVESIRASRIACLVPRANDFDCLSNDWFACVRLLHLRPVSMVARNERQEDTSFRNCSFRNWWTKRGETGEQTSLHHLFPENCRETRWLRYQFAPDYEDNRAVGQARTWLE